MWKECNNIWQKKKEFGDKKKTNFYDIHIQKCRNDGYDKFWVYSKSTHFWWYKIWNIVLFDSICYTQCGCHRPHTAMIKSLFQLRYEPLYYDFPLNGFFFRFYVPVPGHFRDMNQYRSFTLQMCQSDMINRIRRSQLVCTFSWFSLDGIVECSSKCFISLTSI